jgi:protein-S-isoprenylcysteine O-methyltransferase
MVSVPTMERVRDLALVLLIAWIVVDNFVVLRRGSRTAKGADRASVLLIFLTNGLGIVLSANLAYARVGSFPMSLVGLQLGGLVLMLAGIAFRSLAIHQLGRYHMPNVATYDDHALVESGLYRRIRHPSYLGAILTFLGYGLALGSWLSACVVLGIILVGYLYRIHVEEKALRATLGARYVEYARRTRRLIPWIY